MNQILSVEMPNKKSKPRTKKANIKSVIIFFCIIAIIFGGTLTALGIYSKSKSNKKVAASEPTESKLEIETVQNTSTIDVTVVGDEEIEKVTYSWSNGEQGEQVGNGTNSLNFSIDIPKGTNTITIIATDVKGGQKQDQKEYTNTEEQQSGTTMEGVDVQLIQEDNTIKIALNSQDTINKVSYYFDNEEPTTQEVNDVKAEYSVEAREGEHLLTIIVVDNDGNEKKTTKTIYIPTLSVVTDTENFIINASDAGKINKVKITLYKQDGQEESQEEELEDLEKYEKMIPLEEGENRIMVTVYNSYGGSITRRVKWNK